jgi:hypothetical protein
MRTKLIGYAFLVLALSTSKQAPAQTPGGLMNMFTAIMGAAIVNNARIEWVEGSIKPDSMYRARITSAGCFDWHINSEWNCTE